MDRPRGHCCARGGSGLGIYRFCHQRSGSAVAGENHGRGCPIAAIPGQGRRQRACSVDCGAGALLCRDCRCDPEFLPAAQIGVLRSKPARLSSGSRAAGVTPPRPAVPTPVEAVPAAISAPPYMPPTVPTPVPTPTPATVSSAAPEPGQFWSPPEPSPQPKPAAPPPPVPPKAKPAKPKAPKEVYYNIVGEPINPTEDD